MGRALLWYYCNSYSSARCGWVTSREDTMPRVYVSHTCYAFLETYMRMTMTLGALYRYTGWAAWIYVIIIGVTLLIVGLSMFLCMRRRRKQQVTIKSHLDMTVSSPSVPSFQHSDNTLAPPWEAPLTRWLAHSALTMPFLQALINQQMMEAQAQAAQGYPPQPGMYAGGVPPYPPPPGPSSYPGGYPPAAGAWSANPPAYSTPMYDSDYKYNPVS